MIAQSVLLSVVFSLRDTLLLLEQNLDYVGEFPWSSDAESQTACEEGDDDTVSIQPPWVHMAGGNDAYWPYRGFLLRLLGTFCESVQ